MKKNIQNRKAQKGKLPLHRRKGYFLNNGDFALVTTRSFLIGTPLYQVIKNTVTYYIPKSVKKIWGLPPTVPRSKRQGTRMGKGKGKVVYFIFKVPKNFIFLRFKLNKKYYKKAYFSYLYKNPDQWYKLSNFLENFKLYYKTHAAIIKILSKFTFLKLKV